MKKLILMTAIATTSLFAEVTTVTPYVGKIDYGNQASTSFKDNAKITGLSLTHGNMAYLWEFAFSHIATEYKNRAITNLNQNDLTLVYGQYFSNYMYRVGAHYINTTDPQLQDGVVAIATFGGYQYYGKDKFSGGLEAYYSYYKNGHDENYQAEKPIKIFQFTPYLSFYGSIDEQWSNLISIKGNIQIARDYVQDSYFSYEISDTLYYENFYATFKFYRGEMRTGVKDGGLTVYNTLDLMKNGYEVQLGYYLGTNAVVTLSYAEHTYSEFDQTFSTLSSDNTSKVALVSFSYSF